jgi:hypothetical protein
MQAANWGWADSDVPAEDGRARPGSSLRPASRGGAGEGERSADAATAAAAALLQKQRLEQAQDGRDGRDGRDAFEGHGGEEEGCGTAAGTAAPPPPPREHRRTARGPQGPLGPQENRGTTAPPVAERPRQPQGRRKEQQQQQRRQQQQQPQQQQPRQPPREPPRERSQGAFSASTGKQRENDHQEQEKQGGLLRRAARIMAEDNDLDTKANGDVPGNHSAMPESKTDGVASEAIARITLDERPRFSLIDQVVGEFVQGFVELERRLHLSRAHTDRDFLSRLAETQTRLLVEGDLGFGPGLPDPNNNNNNNADDESGGENSHLRQQQQQLAAHAQFERDERLVTQLELHHGEISELMWSALATKGEVQRRGARELMDHAVTELRSCLERQEEEFKAHSAWLRATCNRKIGAARAAGDTAHAQVRHYYQKHNPSKHVRTPH